MVLSSLREETSRGTVSFKSASMFRSIKLGHEIWSSSALISFFILVSIFVGHCSLVHAIPATGRCRRKIPADGANPKSAVEPEAAELSCCPKRRARYRKCVRRRRKRQKRQQEQHRRHGKNPDEGVQGMISDEEACGGECMFYRFVQRLHLPAPLPFYRHKRNKRRRTADHRSEGVDQDFASDGNGSNEDKNESAAAEALGNANPAVPETPMPPTRVSTTAVASLIDLARMQQWQEILQERFVDRRGARYRDADGLYPLHWACSGGPPVEVVRALLDRYPGAARKRDREGSAPLHFACHYAASVDVVDVLIGLHPGAVRLLDRYGRSPLYHAVDRSAGPDVLRALVGADPSMTLVPCLPPVDSGKRRGGERLPPSAATDRVGAVRTPLYFAWCAVVADRHARMHKRGKKWDKAVLLLEAAVRYGRPDWSPRTAALRTFRLLHAAIRMDLYLPDLVADLVLQAHPEQARERDDETGQYPLALAASLRQYSVRRSEALTELLLTAFPAAARDVRDHQGRSPLGHAVATAGKSWKEGVGRLFDAAPDVVRWMDRETGLPLALLAAAAAPSCASIYEEDSYSSSSCTAETAPSSASTQWHYPMALRKNDPYHLLTSKQIELMHQPCLDSMQPLCHGSLDAAQCGDAFGNKQLGLVYQLLLKDPSVVNLAAAVVG